ncbi:hypothetical protein BC936DRAFT_148054 [Jimgerdemannia flammicorona]|uniref:Myb-like domain-containing protein n=1 Tax=Jimgerdemannia flammicorona TaxID=994334 RepID=A0A433D3W9_9FUNG|nr:hypothetical protein BC936DRAFT_148054 [Jimgerdemannia flammicorona]
MIKQEPIEPPNGIVQFPAKTKRTKRPRVQYSEEAEGPDTEQDENTDENFNPDEKKSSASESTPSPGTGTRGRGRGRGRPRGTSHTTHKTPDAWTKEEDRIVIDHVIGTVKGSNWNELAEKLEGRHPAGSCAARWNLLKKKMLS